jgi:hypothetical protein
MREIDIVTLCRRLCSSEWRRTWLQNGAFARYPSNPPGSYSEGLVLETEHEFFELGAYAEHDAVDGEVFSLFARELETPSGVESDAQPRRVAPRVPLDVFPEDLNLRSLYEIPIVAVTIGVLRHGGGTVCVSGVILYAGANKVLFCVDERVPESMLTTMTDDMIAAWRSQNDLQIIEVGRNVLS